MITKEASYFQQPCLFGNYFFLVKHDFQNKNNYLKKYFYSSNNFIPDFVNKNRFVELLT